MNINWFSAFVGALGAIAAALITAASAVYIHRRNNTSVDLTRFVSQELTAARKEADFWRRRCDECGKLLTSARLEVMRLRAGFK